MEIKSLLYYKTSNATKYNEIREHKYGTCKSKKKKTKKCEKNLTTTTKTTTITITTRNEKN